MLGNLDYLRGQRRSGHRAVLPGSSAEQYSWKHTGGALGGRWDEGQVLFVAWARAEEAEIICNRIQSKIHSMVLPMLMGKINNLDLSQCLYHFRPEQEPGVVLGKLEAAVAKLSVQEQGGYSGLLLVA